MRNIFAHKIFLVITYDKCVQVGVNLFSVFMSGENSLSDSQLIDTFHTAAKLGGVVSVDQSEHRTLLTNDNARCVSTTWRMRRWCRRERRRCWQLE